MAPSDGCPFPGVNVLGSRWKNCYKSTQIPAKSTGGSRLIQQTDNESKKPQNFEQKCRITHVRHECDFHLTLNCHCLNFSRKGCITPLSLISPCFVDKAWSTCVKETLRTKLESKRPFLVTFRRFLCGFQTQMSIFHFIFWLHQANQPKLPEPQDPSKLKFSD